MDSHGRGGACHMIYQAEPSPQPFPGVPEEEGEHEVRPYKAAASCLGIRGLQGVSGFDEAAEPAGGGGEFLGGAGFGDFGGFGGGDDLVHGGLGVAVADVVEDAVVEEEGFLLDEGEVAAELVAANISQVVGVECDNSRCGVVEAEEEIEDGGFAGAAGAAE